MKIDKEKAKNGNYRISEKILFIIAILLGGVGIYSGSSSASSYFPSFYA